MTSKKVVLDLYKRLFRVSKEVFDQDKKALSEAQRRIQIEFKKNKALEKTEEIQEKIKIGEDVSKILKTQMVQLVKINPETNTYEMKIRKDTAKLDNVIFNEDIIIPTPTPRSKKCG